MIVELRLCDRDEPGAAREAVERRIVLDGRQYFIDLCDVHGAELDEMVAGWAKTARKVARSPGRRDRVLTAKVRRWAIAEGLLTQSAGRIPQEVWAMYRQGSQVNGG